MGAALIELFIATAVVIGTTGYGVSKIVEKIGSSEWSVRRRQRRNRERIERDAKFRCNEHKKVYERTELVARGNALYCPECYKQYLFAESSDSKVITDLGDIHKDLGLKP